MAASSKTLSALLQKSTIDDHEEILKVCNATLKQSKDDVDVQHAKFVALIKLDRYEDALRVLEECGGKLKQNAKVERAYALYKVGDLEQAKSIAKAIADDRGARHVEAQAVCPPTCPDLGCGLFMLTTFASRIVRKTSQMLRDSTRILPVARLL